MFTTALHLLYWSFRCGSWVVAGCYNGSRYKKGWKPLIAFIRHLLFCSNKLFFFKRLL